jgi:hypothetical protein
VKVDTSPAELRAFADWLSERAVEDALRNEMTLHTS